jgi:hypothetical protein
MSGLCFALRKKETHALPRWERRKFLNAMILFDGRSANHATASSLRHGIRARLRAFVFSLHSRSPSVIYSPLSFQKAKSSSLDGLFYFEPEFFLSRRNSVVADIQLKYFVYFFSRIEKLFDAQIR